MTKFEWLLLAMLCLTNIAICGVGYSLRELTDLLATINGVKRRTKKDKING